MRKVEINGVAKIDARLNKERDWAAVEVNGIDIQQMLADRLLEIRVEGERMNETSLCRVTICIEPYAETLVVNGKEMALEL